LAACRQRKATDLALQICSGLKERMRRESSIAFEPEKRNVDAQGNVKIMDFGIGRAPWKRARAA